MHLETGGRGCVRRALQPVEFARQARGVILERPLAIGARMQLDDLRAEPCRGLDGLARPAR